MKHIKFYTIISLLIFSLNIKAQTGPGGVGSSSNNELWLKSDGNVYEDAGTDLAESGDGVFQWNDSGAFARHIQQTNSADRPEYVTNALNSYPVIRFDSSNSEFLGILDLDAFQNNYSIFVVGYTSGNDQDFVSITFDGDVNHGILIEGVSGNRLRFLHRNPINIGGGDNINNGSTRSLSQSQILSFTRGTPSTGIQQFWINGTDNQSTTASSPNFTSSNARLQIGRLRPGHARYLNGDISEVIILSKEANTAERIIIENYLSAKYGLTLGGNDLYTQDDSGQGNFDHDVAGIGQASSVSNHTDSQGTGIVRMHTPSALSNGDYLFWGEETKDPTYDFSSNTSNYTEQLNSRWRVSKVNDLGTVTVTFDLDPIDLSGIDTSCQPMQLMVDNNGDFSSPTIYPLTIAGTTATATGVNFNDADYFTMRFVNQIVWDGTQYLYGSGAGNAPDNTDSCLKLLVKSGASGTLTFDAHVKEIEIEAGGTLNVADGILLETEDNVVINGVIDLQGEAQLIQNHNATTSNSGTGYLLKRQQGEGNLHNYNYWSSPVNNGGSWQIGQLEDASGPIAVTADPNSSISPTTISSRWLYTYNATSNTYAAWAQASATTPLAPGIGFTMKGVPNGSSQEYVFKGIPNDGDYTYPVVAGNDFLIGNPYPSALDADEFIVRNTPVIDGSLYFWEHFATNNSHYRADYEGGYAIYNLMMPSAAPGSSSVPTNKIAVGQGFFVTIIANGTIQFKNDQRVFARESLSESIFLKTSSKKSASVTDQRTKIWFSLEEPGGIAKTFALGYDSKATSDYDSGYDAINFDYLRNDISWKLDDKKLVIQALPAINENDELPLEIKATDSGVYKIAINTMQFVPTNTNIFLKDNNLGTYYDLKNTTANIYLNTGTYNNFSIVFKQESTLNIAQVETRDTFVVYNNTIENLEIHTTLNLKDISSFDIYNTIGQKVKSYKTLDKNSVLDISGINKGIYILKLKSANNNNIDSIKFSNY